MRADIESRAKNLRVSIAAVYNAFGKLILDYDRIYNSITGKRSTEIELIGQQINKDKEQLLDDESRIIVVGETNVGKSQFINLILGQEILSVNSSTETAVLTIIKSPKELSKFKVHFFPSDYIERLKDRIEFTDSSEKFFIKRLIKNIDSSIEAKELIGSSPESFYYDGDNRKFISELVKYSSATHQPSFANVVEYIELFYESDVTLNSVQLIDSPGLNDVNPLRPNLTRAYIEKADVIVIMIDQSGIKETIRDIIKFIVVNKLAEKIVFVVSKVDIIDDVDLFISHLKSQLKSDVFEVLKDEISEIIPDARSRELTFNYMDTIIGDYKIFPISAKKALENKGKENVYYKQYENLLEYLNNYFDSDEFILAKASKYLSRYGDQIYYFEDKIKNTNNEISERDFVLAKDELSIIEAVEKELYCQMEPVLIKFGKDLDAEIQKEFDFITSYWIKKTKKDIKFLLEKSDIYTWNPLLRNRRVKEVIENRIQPAIIQNMSLYQQELNNVLEERIELKVSKLEKEFSQTLEGLKNKFILNKVFNKSNSSRFSTFINSLEINQSEDKKNIFLTTAIASSTAGILAIFLLNPLALTFELLVVAGGVFSTLLNFIKKDSGVTGGQTIFNSPTSSNRMIKVLTEKINEEIDNMESQIREKFDSSGLVDRLSDEIEKQIEFYFAQIKDPLLISLESRDDEAIVKKFEGVQVAATRLRSLFDKMRKEYGF